MVVTSGITGTMVGSGAGVQKSTLWQVACRLAPHAAGDHPDLGYPVLDVTRT